MEGVIEKTESTLLWSFQPQVWVIFYGQQHWWKASLEEEDDDDGVIAIGIKIILLKSKRIDIKIISYGVTCILVITWQVLKFEKFNISMTMVLLWPSLGLLWYAINHILTSAVTIDIFLYVTHLLDRKSLDEISMGSFVLIAF